MNTRAELRQHVRQTPDGDWAVEVYVKPERPWHVGDPHMTMERRLCRAGTFEGVVAEVEEATGVVFEDSPADDGMTEGQRRTHEAMCVDLWVKQELVALYNPGFMARLLDLVWRRAERDLEIALTDMGPLHELVPIAKDIQPGGSLQVDVLARYQGEASGCRYWATVSRDGQIGRVADVTGEFRAFSQSRAFAGGRA